MAFDRGSKLALYARAGIQEYCVVNLNDRRVEVHRSPAGNSYTDTTFHDSSSTLTAVAAPRGTIRVSELLP